MQKDAQNHQETTRATSPSQEEGRNPNGDADNDPDTDPRKAWLGLATWSLPWWSSSTCLRGFELLSECCWPAEFRVPVHGVNVEEHGATGVCHVSAVDPSTAAPRQALGKSESDFLERHDSKTASPGAEPPLARVPHSPRWSRSPPCQTWRARSAPPDAPRPRCPAASAASLHWSKCWWEGLSCAGERDQGHPWTGSLNVKHTRWPVFFFCLQTFRWFLSFPGALLMRFSTVDCVRRSNQTTELRFKQIPTSGRWKNPQSNLSVLGVSGEQYVSTASARCNNATVATSIASQRVNICPRIAHRLSRCDLGQQNNPQVQVLLTELVHL